MPNETKQAVEWALQQYVDGEIGKVYVKDDNNIINHGLIVTFVSKYFKNNNIEYETFDYNDLKSYL